MNTIDMRPKTEDEEVKETAEETEGQKETEEVKEAEEKETPSETSTEGEAEEGEAEKTDDKVLSDEDTTSQKSVDETEIVKEEDIVGLAKQREKLLTEIRELRQERRDKKDEKKEPLIVPKEEKIDLSDVAEADINLVEKILKAKGYVRKDEIQNLTYKEKIDSYKNQWLESHPEYLPENDTEDVKWSELNSAVSRFFRSPESPKDIVKVLDAAHSMVSKTSLPKKTSATSQAAKEKVKTLSKSSGGGGEAKPSPKSSGVSRDSFVGFSEEELKEMGV